MAIKIRGINGQGIVSMAGNPPIAQEVDILADAEAEILALGEIVTDMFNVTVKVAKGSQAHTAGYKEVYEYSPSGVWVKM